MKIYQAQPHNVDTLPPLYLGYHHFYEVEENVSRTRDFILKHLRLNESVIFHAEVDGKAVGFTQLYPLFCFLEMKRTWLLYDLFVDESARRFGVTQTLISRAEQLAKEGNSAFIILSAAADNTRAQALYECNGFVWDTQFYVYNKLLQFACTITC